MFKKRHQQTFYLVVTAILIALVMIMALVPYVGYIPIIPGAIEVTLIHIPVLIGLMILPFFHSLSLGLFFGLSSLVVAFIRPDLANIPFQNPLISVLPRVLFVLITYFIFYGTKYLSEKLKYGSIVIYGITVLLIAMVIMLGFYYLGINISKVTETDFVPLFLIIGAVLLALLLTFYFATIRRNDYKHATIPATLIIGTLIHTILVLSLLSLIKPVVLGNDDFLSFFLAVMSANGFLEIVVALLVGTPVINALKMRFLALNRQHALKITKNEDNK